MQRIMILSALTLLIPFALVSCATTVIRAGGEIQRSAPCIAPDKERQEDCFEQPENAPLGKARVYVFRPDFSALGAKDAPMLIVDDAIEVTIKRLNYAPLDLDLGKHPFVVIPAKADAQNWNLSGVLDLTASGRYYLAIWNSDTGFERESQPGDTGTREGLKQGIASMAIAVAATVATGLVVYPIYTPSSPRWKVTRSESRFEVIEEKDALEFIRQCTITEPRRH